jgi:hypothetical protein
MDQRNSQKEFESNVHFVCYQDTSTVMSDCLKSFRIDHENIEGACRDKL